MTVARRPPCVSGIARWLPGAKAFTTRLRAEGAQVQGFMHLVMKPRNGQPWSVEDRVALRAHLKAMARALPLLALFALPGGSLLLPLLALLLDRRTARGARPEGDRRGAGSETPLRRGGGSA